MSKKYRFIYFILSITILIVLSLCIEHNISILLSNFWFSSGLLLLILLSLIDQPHYSKDSNIFINTITAAMSLLLVKKQDYDWVFWLFVVGVIYLVISSYVLMWMRNKPLNEENQIVQYISRVNRHIGKPETLFSAFFLWGAVKQFSMNSTQFNMLLWYWIIFMILNIPGLSKIIEDSLSKQRNKQKINPIGQIFRVQSTTCFIAKVYSSANIPLIKIFDFVKYRYSLNSEICFGLIIDIYYLDQEQWIKILTNKEINSIFSRQPKNDICLKDIVYKVQHVPNTDYINRFVGTITEYSTISKICFLYKSKNKIYEGQLLEVLINDIIVLYQVIEGVTKIEQLEKRNETGNIIGEAIQLGTWNKEKFRFDQFGWVANVNTPVFIASNINKYSPQKNEFIIGYLPETEYPVVLSKELSITHHTAILGVTGTGKSVFSRNLIKQYLEEDDIKVICIDFTKEYKAKFQEYNPIDIVSSDKNTKIFENISFLNNELEKFANNQNKNLIDIKTSEINSIFKESINSFLTSDRNISIFEHPELSNTIGVLDYIRYFFDALFKIAKENKSYGKKICIVLEEAHTIIPEWNFIGISDKKSSSLVNKIGQIALQGRKYNIGFLVIAQRTANVSKTVLTQCNSVIAFQEFDRTSSEFLSNYFGEKISATLPNLKFRQAIAAGKAFKSNVPMIFEVPIIDE